MAKYIITIGENEIGRVDTDKERLGDTLTQYPDDDDIGLYRENELIDKFSKDEKFEYSINNIPDETIVSLLKEKCYNLIDEFNLGL